MSTSIPSLKWRRHKPGLLGLWSLLRYGVRDMWTARSPHGGVAYVGRGRGPEGEPRYAWMATRNNRHRGQPVEYVPDLAEARDRAMLSAEHYLLQPYQDWKRVVGLRSCLAVNP